MPITIADAPDTLPKAAKKIYVGAYNGAYTGDCKDEGDRRTECARRIAWGAVKKKYKKAGEKWVAKAALVSVDLFVIKASLQDDGTMRWLCTASDTAADNRQDHTTISLFHDWIRRVEENITLPFLPEPRTPFLGLSHYPSLDGFGEAGITDRMYVDGNQFKAGGIFNDTRLGREMFDAIRTELAAIKQGDVPDSPIRISAAWWDVEHAHGDFRFKRTDLDEICPMCLEALSKTFLKGQLDHFAGTRVPINPRTSLKLEEKSMPITRKDDAVSIVSSDLADELEERTKEVMAQRSDADAEDPTAALIVKADDATEGDTTADATAADDNADAQDSGTAPREPSGVATDETPAPVAASDADEDPPDADASTANGVVQERNIIEVVEIWRPFGGATSIEDAEDWMAAQDRMYEMYDQWSLFRAVMENILDDEEITNKVAAVRKAITQFGDRVDTIKSEATDAFLARSASIEGVTMTQGETTMSDKTKDEKGVVDESQTTEVAAPEPAVTVETDVAGLDPGAAFWSAMSNVVVDLSLTREQMLERAQLAMDALAQATHNLINGARPPQADSAEMKSMVQSAVTAAVGPLAEQVALLLARSQAVTAPTAPVQKSYVQPVMQENADVGISGVPAPVSNIKALARRSVGLPA